MPRSRYQRGSLHTSRPTSQNKAGKRLTRGTFWAQWYQYVTDSNGKEARRRRERIINKDVAAEYDVAFDKDQPLTKAQAQQVLDKLIAEDSGTFVRPDRRATFEQVAREYIALHEPNWGPHTARTSGGLIEYSLIGGSLGQRLVTTLAEIELQQFLNEHVSAGASQSKMQKILLYLRGILDHAVLKKIIPANPARNPGYKLKARSHKAPSERYLSFEECRRLLSVVLGEDHLILRTFIQLGLRPEELFALRRDDFACDMLRIDEALVEGKSAGVKSTASAATVYIPPDLQTEFNTWVQGLDVDPRGWIFPGPKGGAWGLQNYLNRRLKPAATRARIGIIKNGERETTDVNFQVLRRTCATLFGAKAKDPRDTQAQLRHSDATTTLKHYQKSIPASVKAAAWALEMELVGSLNRAGIEHEAEEWGGLKQ